MTSSIGSRLLSLAVIALLTAGLFWAARWGWSAAFEPDLIARAAQNVAVTRQFSPTTEAAVTTSAGDDNGYETTPTSAFADGGGSAVDTDSGTTGGTPNSTCTAAGSDKHRFGAYGMGIIPTASTISGFAVRADIVVDALTHAPFTCTELSQNGGASYSAAKQLSLSATAETTYTFGGSADLWGLTWTTSELTNVNFEVRAINGDTNNGNSDRDFSLDWLPVSVTYTAPWDSYETGCSPQQDSFAGSTNVVCAKGSGFETGAGLYSVGFYDGGGTQRICETGLTAAGGALQTGNHGLQDVSYVAGTWNVVAFRNASCPAGTYAAVSGAPDTNNIIANDAFTVDASAIPEFPTVLAAVVAAGAAVGGYLLLRRRMAAGTR